MKPKWRELTHAYGSAEDIPEILGLLKYGDQEDRKEAIDLLYGNIFHQGTIYEATGFAVEFLIDLLLDAKAEDKKEIFGLIGSIYQGTYRVPVKLNAKNIIEKRIAEIKQYYNSTESEERVWCEEGLEYLQEFAVLIGN
ncbi:MAG: hypothetical protein MRY83_01125 [Flavobacteriales bacterium]|nr:hypothetical protein [Flavobacteriales bacterium]